MQSDMNRTREFQILCRIRQLLRGAEEIVNSCYLISSGTVVSVTSEEAVKRVVGDGQRGKEIR